MIGATVDQGSGAGPRGSYRERAEAFLMAMAVDMRFGRHGSKLERNVVSRSSTPPKVTARLASALASLPGSRDTNSSRKVMRHEGSRPTTSASPASAASVRRASARAFSIRPAAR